MTIYWPESTNLRRPKKRGKSTKPRKSPEHDLQKQVVKALRKHCRPTMAKWAAIPNGGHRNLLTALRMKAEGVERGAPDLFFILQGGRAALLELKAKGGSLKPEQKLWRDEVTALGALWETANSFDQAYGILAAWGCLPSEVKTVGQK